MTRRLKHLAALAAVAAGMLTAAQPASADYCSDFGMCETPRYTVYYSYDWYWTGETLRRYQIRTCYWYSTAGYVYAVSYC